MKSFVRSLIINAVSLYLVSLIIPGVIFQNGLQGLVFTTLVLAIVNLIIRPLVSLLLLPINLLTLGTFRWLTNVIVLYSLSLISPDFTITGFNLNQIPLSLFSTSHLSLGVFWSLVVTSFTFSLIQSFFRWFLR